jgi:integrase
MISSDVKVRQMFLRKDISASRKKQYVTMLREVYEITNKTPSQLIAEAKEEEQPFIVNGVPRIRDIDERKLTNYFYQYYESLLNKKLNNSTIDSKLKSLRAFYNEHNIALPRPIKLDIPIKIIREGDIPNIDDIRKGFMNATTLRNKALILFMASTGIRSSDVRKFKVSDFTQATKEYHNGNSIEDLLDGNYKSVIPCWDFTPQKTRKAGNICVTFNTPEATNAIINYLKTRNNLQEDDYLFISQYKKRIGPHGIIWMFKQLNDRHFHKDNGGNRFFHAHAMRKFFISTVKHHTNDYKKAKILSGHAISKIEIAYEEIKKDVMKEFYAQLIPYLSIEDTKVYNIKSKEYLDLENELSIKEEENRLLLEKLGQKV